MKRIAKQGLLILAGVGLAFSGPAQSLINQLKVASVGGDATVRIDLRQMTRDVMAPPVNEARRLEHETDLLNGLNTVTDDNQATVRAHLIRELQMVGRAASVDPLASYLDNNNLYEPALQALIVIFNATGDENVRAVIRTAMAGASGGRLASLMRAAGSIQDPDAGTQDILLANAVQADWALRGVALRSLANIGDPGARQVLADAIAGADNDYQQSKIITWNLDYARRLAARNQKVDAKEIANEIKSFAQDNDLCGSQTSQHAIDAADYTLGEIDEIPVMVKKMAQSPAGNMLDIESLEKGFRINIQVDKDYSISITDVMGKVMWSKKGSEPGSYRVSKSLLGAGVYAVRVKSGNQSAARYIVLH